MTSSPARTHPRILWVDDDRFYPPPHHRDELEFAGYAVEVVRTVQKAQTAIAASQPALVILDIKMPVPRRAHVPAELRDRGGIWLAKWIKAEYPELPFIGLSVDELSGDADLLTRHGAGYIPKGDLLIPGRLVRCVRRAFEGSSLKTLNTFIVHGSDATLMLELKDFLRRLGMRDPTVLEQMASGTMSIMDKFEYYAGSVDVAFVLLAPEDELVALSGSGGTRAQPRPNVLLELGYFLGTFGRASGRVILLYKSGASLPSNISGIVYIDVSHGVVAAGEAIRRELDRIVSDGG